MDRTLTWLRTERLSVADLLEDLSDSEWRADSLCPGRTGDRLTRTPG